jgi:ssRNA-specific RNase YbeY (16S rRNA maturation enzyme)
MNNGNKKFTRACAFSLQLIRTIKSHLFTALLLMLYVLPAHGNEKYQLEDFKSQLGYFKQITLGNYKKYPSRRIMKWTSDVKIYLKDDLPSSWDTELNKVLEELNQLTNHVSLIRVTDEESANFFIFSKSLESYQQFEPLAQDYGTDILSLSISKENSDYELIHGSMFISPLKFQDPSNSYGKHVLRTYFTSSLGLSNTSRKYYDSIFLDDSIGAYVTEFSNLDKTIIKTLYDDCIKAGMDQIELDHALKHDGYV